MYFCAKLFVTCCEDFADCSTEFVDCWKRCYRFPKSEKYCRNIVRVWVDSPSSNKVDEEAIRELFKWKSGGRLSPEQIQEIEDKIIWLGKCVKSGMSKKKIITEAEKKYLCRKKGGPIYNIFFLHCLAPKKWPMFDQHTYRAMMYIKTGEIHKGLSYWKTIWKIYKEEYIPFFNKIYEECKHEGFTRRDVDKALFAFGDFLNTFRPDLKK